MRKKHRKKLNIKKLCLFILLIILITILVKNIIFTNSSLELLDKLFFTTTDNNG